MSSCANKADENSFLSPESIRIQCNQSNSPSEALSGYLETTRQRIDNCNMQTLGGNTSLRYATEGRLLDDHTSSISTSMTTSIEGPCSNESPLYDDVMQQRAIVITIEEESSPPPTYNDFIRQTYRSEEWS